MLSSLVFFLAAQPFQLWSKEKMSLHQVSDPHSRVERSDTLSTCGSELFSELITWTWWGVLTDRNPCLLLPESNRAKLRLLCRSGETLCRCCAFVVPPLHSRHVHLVVGEVAVETDAVVFVLQLVREHPGPVAPAGSAGEVGEAEPFNGPVPVCITHMHTHTRNKYSLHSVWKHTVLINGQETKSKQLHQMWLINIWQFRRRNSHIRWSHFKIHNLTLLLLSLPVPHPPFYLLVNFEDARIGPNYMPSIHWIRNMEAQLGSWLGGRS